MDETAEAKLVVAWCPRCKEQGLDRSFNGWTEPQVARALVRHFFDEHGLTVLRMPDALAMVRGKEEA